MMLRALIIMMAMVCSAAGEEKTANINTVMMESTCKIVGTNSLGSGFVIGKADSAKKDVFHFVLVTAHHVLAQCQGENMYLVLRKLKDEANQQWERITVPVRIRDSSRDLWTKHPDVDLAAMFVQLPDKCIRFIIPDSLLLTDDKIKEFEIGPGTELLCLGYPLGDEANPQGFPILRSGKIASYPLLPTKATKSFLFDFSVFRGNSGGPVYLYEKASLCGGLIQGIMGIVTIERNVTQHTEQLYERRETVTPLALGEVIHASFIKELIDGRLLSDFGHIRPSANSHR
jgi:hypothetical protein